VYYQVIRRDLLNAIRKKRPALIDNMENIIFHQDNAPCHRSQETQLELDVIGFQRLPHAPYSPDLAPLDFAVFPYLKSQLRGQRFENFSELRQETLRVLSTLKQDYFENVYNKWVARHRKCIEKHGEYFEKH
jgi:histone-lysine N-methyltransferase SETMAR